MLTEETRSFSDDAAGDGSKETGSVRLNQHKNNTLAISVVTNVVLLFVCIALGIIVMFRSGPDRSRPAKETAGHSLVSTPYSPANGIIEYELRTMIPNDTRYTGPPGLGWEQSMSELMSGTLIRISKDELKLSGSESIPLKDGGYAAGLGVAHNLHCVKKIKQFLYRELVYTDVAVNSERFDYLQSHADHCLDFLRQGIMCHLDYSMYTLYWGERRQDIPTHHSPGPQKCVNWDSLHKWMLKRAANTDMMMGP